MTDLSLPLSGSGASGVVLKSLGLGLYSVNLKFLHKLRFNRKVLYYQKSGALSS